MCHIYINQSLMWRIEKAGVAKLLFSTTFSRKTDYFEHLEASLVLGGFIVAFLGKGGLEMKSK